MKRKLSMIALLTFALLGLTAALIQADFIQCPGGGANCTGSGNSDLMNGTPGGEIIAGFEGDDFIFGDAGDDAITGDGNNDFIFGGLGADSIFGASGNDTLLAGPDLPDFGQFVSGSSGNDVANVLVAETIDCLVIDAGTGTDLVNLIGFGPYTAVQPFGVEGFTEGWVYLLDPIAGGEIYIRVYENGDMGAEAINGLLSPNVTILEGGFEVVDGCVVPRGFSGPNVSRSGSGD